MRPEGGDKSEGGHWTWMLDGMFFETQEEPHGLPCPSQGAIVWPHKAWGLVLEAARLREGLSTDVPSGPGTGQGKATTEGAMAKKSRRNALHLPGCVPGVSKDVGRGAVLARPQHRGLL